MMLEGKKIGIIGIGNMGEAILRGLRGGGFEAVAVNDLRPEKRNYAKKTYKVAIVKDNRELVSQSDIVIVAVKPQDFKNTVETLAPALDTSTVLISVAAGISIGNILSFLGKDSRIIRAMPNVCAMVLESATALARGGSSTDSDLSAAQDIFDAMGKTVIVSERLMDVITALSASGPAYVFIFIEALADGGVKMGLPRNEALTLAAQTVFGAARLLMDQGEHPGALKDKVASPGGTTMAGIAALEDGGFRGTVIDAVTSATERSKELGKIE